MQPISRDQGARTESSASDDDATLWKTYVSRRDMGTRALLVQRNLRIAQIVAASMYALRYDDSVDFNDYLQYARIGLIEAVDRFDPAREASFRTYASHRIRGAILNGLEIATERLSQSTYRRQVMKERATSLQSEADTAAGKFAEMVELTIGLALGYVLEDSGLWKETDESGHSDPYRVYELKCLRERLTMILRALPEREQKIVKLHYFDHLEFYVIAEEMGLTKGRVSQLHARAMKLLRQAYDELGRFEASY
jgi:RNA polymerase sigma factor FliA